MHNSIWHQEIFCFLPHEMTQQFAIPTFHKPNNIRSSEAMQNLDLPGHFKPRTPPQNIVPSLLLFFQLLATFFSSRCHKLKRSLCPHPTTSSSGTVLKSDSCFQTSTNFPFRIFEAQPKEQQVTIVQPLAR